MTTPGNIPDHSLEKLLEFETLISNTSAALFAAAPDGLDLAVEQSLKSVRKFFQADRCALLSVSSDQQIVNVRLASYSAGIGSVSPDLNLAEYFPWTRHRLLVERLPIRVSRMAELPPEADVEVEMWNQMQIQSALTLPIERAGIVSHIILLNSVHQECEWSDALVTRLQVFGELLAGALERQDMFNVYRESEKRLDLAADFAGAGLWSVDIRTRHVWGNERLRGIFGYPPDTAISIELVEAVIHPDDLDFVRSSMGSLTLESDALDVEYRILRPGDGTQRWIKSRGRPYFGSTGELELVMGVSIDITEPKIVEEELRQSQNLLAKGGHLAGLAFYEVDFGNGTIYLDSTFRDICGITPDVDQGLAALEFWMQHLHPEDRPRVFRMRQQLHEGTIEQITVEYRYLNPITGLIWIKHLGCVATRDAAGVPVVSFGVLQDVSETRKAEEDLHELSRQLITAHEEERALLARELHDDLTQRLAVLAIEIGRSESTVSNPLYSNTLRSVREEVVSLSEDIHALAYHLHPSVLTELGLVEALRTESERRNRQAQVQVSLDLEPNPPDITKDEALCLFRVAQESLNNVTRHAGVDAAEISLKQVGGGLLLTVSDRGIGFQPGSLAPGKHLGLLSMRERVRLVDGTLDIESGPDQGTKISAWVPCKGDTP